MLANKQLSKHISELDSLIDTYNKSQEKPQRDFSKYENNYLQRLKKAINFFQELSNKAINMLKETNVSLESIRLDRYYSGKNLVKSLNKDFSGIKCYLIPKKRTLARGCTAWLNMLNEFYKNTNKYFEEYFKRNQSESGFSEDKRRFGWRIPQKIESRIDMAYFSIFTWHNLLWMGQ